MQYADIRMCGCADKKYFIPSTIRKNETLSILNTQYSIVMWDVLSGDFDQSISEEKCLENVLSKTRTGSIIVFHDSIKAKKNLYYTLPKVLDHFSKEGFVFENLALTLSKGEGTSDYKSSLKGRI